MILSVSRRTDIPAFYSDWFFNRIHEGYVDVRNPMNAHQVSRIKITPDVVDCIVFWTKNPYNMLMRLDELKEYNYYFQFTINPYDKQIEKNVPFKTTILETFSKLSQQIGSNRIIWRYDPILITDKINVAYHVKYYEELAKRLESLTTKCVISFVDLYKKTITNTKIINLQEPSQSEMRYLAEKFVNIARKYGIQVLSCAESINLSEEGVEHGCCIDPNLIEDICGYHIDVKKDENQREECGCVESIDIGAYNTCCHACAYCYANFNNEKVRSQSSKHHKNSSLLIGDLSEDDVIKIRKVGLLKSHRLF